MMWLLHFDTTRPPDVLMIDLIKLKTDTRIFFYDSHSDTETYPDESCRGRLQCDLQLARRGRLECALTDLRLSDTGTYLSIVLLNGERSYKPCDLNVTGKMTSASPSDLAFFWCGPFSVGKSGLFTVSLSLILVHCLCSSHQRPCGRNIEASEPWEDWPLCRSICVCSADYNTFTLLLYLEVLSKGPELCSY